MIKAIVFDFDGVLADTEPLHFRAYQEVLKGVGTALTREEYYGQLVGYNDEDCFRLLARSLCLPEEEIDPGVSFDALGLDSASRVGLAVELGREVGVNVDPEATLDHPTVRALAGFLAASATTPEGWEGTSWNPP